MKNKLVVMIFLPAVFIAKAYSQLPPFSIGFKVGPTYSFINDLETTISPRPTDSTIYIPYTINKQKRWGGSAGLYGIWTLKGDEANEERIMAIQVQILYSSQGSNLIYQEKNGFNYKMQFRYNYINIPVDVKVFPFGFVTRNNNWPNYFTGLNFGVGAQLGFNITPENIVYTSNISPIAGTDLDRQQQLRNVLKGRDNFGFRACIGYEFICGPKYSYINKGISLELSCYLGLTDVVETLPSVERFIETRNRNTCWQITLGIDFNRLKQFLNDGYSSCY